MNDTNLATSKEIYSIFEGFWPNLKPDHKDEFSNDGYYVHTPDRVNLVLVRRDHGTFVFHAYSDPMGKHTSHRATDLVTLKVYPERTVSSDCTPSDNDPFNTVTANKAIKKTEFYLTQFLFMNGVAPVKLPLYSVLEITRPGSEGSARREMRRGASEEKHHHKPKRQNRGIECIL